MKLYDVQAHPEETMDTALMMKEVYLDFFSKSIQPDNLGLPFNKRLNVETKEHNEIIQKIFTGKEPMPYLEKNPLLEKESDFNIDLRGMDGYTLKSQGTFINPSKERIGISDGAKKTALNFINKLKQRKLSSEADKITEVTEEQKEDGDENPPPLVERTGEENKEAEPAKPSDVQQPVKTETDASAEDVANSLIQPQTQVVDDKPVAEEKKEGLP